MKKVKSFVALLLAAIFMMSFLCACDGIMPVKVDKEVDAFLDEFFEATEQENYDKVYSCWLIPEDKVQENYERNESDAFILRMKKNGLNEAERIKYEKYKKKEEQIPGFTVHEISFVLECEDLEGTLIDEYKESGIPGNMVVLTNHESNESKISAILILPIGVYLDFSDFL